jgi:signal transduction histidine kinase
VTLEELEDRNRGLEAEVQRKTEALANLAHDLRTPLSAIMGFAEMMHDVKAGPITSDQKDLLGDILTSSRQILGLIDGLPDPPLATEPRTVEGPP